MAILMSVSRTISSLNIKIQYLKMKIDLKNEMINDLVKMYCKLNIYQKPLNKVFQMKSKSFQNCKPMSIEQIKLNSLCVK